MNEVLADVSALTGQAKYLQLARRFSHEALLAPLAESRDPLDGLHANTQIPKVIGFQRIFELTGDERYGAAARFFWQTVVERRSFVTGGHGDGEHFFPPSEFAKHLPSAKTMETCCTHNMLRLTRMLFQASPSAAYADYYERALYNGILPSQDPRERDDDVFPGHAARIRPAVPHAGAVLLVLHRDRDGEPRQVRRLDLLPRGGCAVDQSLHSVHGHVEGEGAAARSIDDVPRDADDASVR